MNDCILFRKFEQTYGGDGSVSELIERICELGRSDRFDYSVMFDTRERFTRRGDDRMFLRGRAHYQHKWYNFTIDHPLNSDPQVLRWTVVFTDIDTEPVAEQQNALQLKTADDVWVSTLIDLIENAKPEPIVDHQANPGLLQERFFEYQLGYQSPF